MIHTGDHVIYLCIGEPKPIQLNRSLPQSSGVTSTLFYTIHILACQMLPFLRVALRLLEGPSPSGRSLQHHLPPVVNIKQQGLIFMILDEYKEVTQTIYCQH